MNFSIDISSAATSTTRPETASGSSPATIEVADLLRQLLDVQREQLAYARQAAAMADNTARWRSYLARWGDEFPDLGPACKAALPHLERSYGRLVTDMTERLTEDDGIDSDFVLQEFLDRYGMRLAQLGTILNLVGPMAEASPPPESV